MEIRAECQKTGDGEQRTGADDGDRSSIYVAQDRQGEAVSTCQRSSRSKLADQEGCPVPAPLGVPLSSSSWAQRKCGTARDELAASTVVASTGLRIVLPSVLGAASV